MSEKQPITEKGPGPIRMLTEYLARPVVYLTVFYGAAWKDPRYQLALKEYKRFEKATRQQAQQIWNTARIDAEFAWELGNQLAAQYPFNTPERTQAYEQRDVQRTRLYALRDQARTDLFNAMFERSTENSNYRRQIAREITEQRLKDGRRK